MTTAADQIVQTLTEFFPEGAALSEPEFSGREASYVRECIETGWVSSVGSFVDRLEDQLSELTGAKYAIATVNGTSALHVCLRLVGVKPGDLVIAPALTFIGTANAISYCGAEPYFVDCEEISLGMNPDQIRKEIDSKFKLRKNGLFDKETDRRVSAVLVTHVLGHPARLNDLLLVCQDFDLPLVEDAAEAIGTSFEGKHVGTFGLLSALSFNGNKTITTGGGGAILTNGLDLAEKAKQVTTTAKEPHKWEFLHNEIAFNYRMPNINAALGVAQLERLSQILQKKRAIAGIYQNSISPINGVTVLHEPPKSRSNYWLNAIVVDEGAAARDEILQKTNDANIQTRPLWRPLHLLPPYISSPRASLSVAENIYERLITIPSSPQLLDQLVEK